MPTFDFLCKKCGNAFEFTRPFGSKDHPSCPACKSKRTEKQMSSPAVMFKGSGWYKTDSRPAEKPAPKPAEKKSEEKKPEVKPPEVKPEKKSETKGQKNGNQKP